MCQALVAPGIGMICHRSRFLQERLLGIGCRPLAAHHLYGILHQPKGYGDTGSSVCAELEGAWAKGTSELNVVHIQ